MVGSAIDGEDIVQDVLAAVYRSPPPLRRAADLRPWLFRAAHNRAVDHLKRYERRMSLPLEAASDMTDDEHARPDRTAVRNESVAEALTRYLVLPPGQRGCLILKEVFDYSLEEIATLLDLTVPAVKSAMLRGRNSIQSQTKQEAVAPRPPTWSPSTRLLRYSSLFNARDWDALREMLVDDVRLELVSRWEKRGRESVGNYFGNYSTLPGKWCVRPTVFEGCEALAFFPERAANARPSYVILLEGIGSGVTQIRDFRHASYILDGSDVGLFLPGVEERL
jgi:RNA polymerase sigma-70 factor (ECF subfamily)